MISRVDFPVDFPVVDFPVDFLVDSNRKRPALVKNISPALSAHGAVHARQ
jgi:hypothetical protein